jgi:dipeptidyl aminopeptidase/acylaminoacyl peptidase
VVVAFSATDRPPEIAAVESGRFRQLSHQNDDLLRDFRFARTGEIAFKSADGREVHALLMTPAGDPPRTRRPALLRLHGGPVWQNQHDFDFGFMWQLFAAHGYTVVAPNPRGSSGRGYEFQRAEFADWGGGEVADVLAAVDKAIRSGSASVAGAGADT